MAAVGAVRGAPAAVDWPEWQDDLPGNVSGSAHALTAFAPMSWWEAAWLWVKFTAIKIRPNVSLQRHHFVYFGRWTIVPRYGTGRRGDRYVLIETNYNGSFADYIDTISIDLTKYMKRIWGPCYGCPPNIQPPSAFRRYARRHELRAQHYFCAYPDATVKEIEAALRIPKRERTEAGGRSARKKVVGDKIAARARALMAIRDEPKITWRARMLSLGGLLWPDRLGRVSALTTLTPIAPNRLEPLKRHLAGLGERSPFAKVPGTHFARLVVIEQLLNEGKSNEPSKVDSPMLLFGAIGDGTSSEYLDKLSKEIPDCGRDIWGKHCRGLDPAGARDPSTLNRYLKQRRLRGGLLYAGYEADVGQVKKALEMSRLVPVAGEDERTRARPAPAPLGESVTAVREGDFPRLQGNILMAYKLPYGAFLLVRIDDPARGTAWLRTLLARLTSASDQARDPSEAWNLAFTFDGLRALGVPEPLLSSFPEDFHEGMQKRAKRLGDEGVNSPARWEPGLRDTDGAHAMLLLRAGSDTARNVMIAHARQGMRDQGLTVVYTQVSDPLPLSEGRGRGELATQRREHFSFVDGISQPTIVGTPRAERDPNPSVKAGEFLLGYLDEEDELPGAARFFRNGSFMVFRKLEQRVGAFRRVVAQNAGDLSEELVAAKAVGRWYDGVPLVLAVSESERRRLDREPLDRRYLNHFNYGTASGGGRGRKNDPHGFRCPLGAHIRRTFPRDALVGGERRTRRHRLLRRGLPYGTPLPEGTVPDPDGDRGRGLLFICFNASIARQFETVQGWCLDGNFFDVPGEPDFLLTPSGATMTVQTKPPRDPHVLTRDEALVVTRGGGYFFYPSMDAVTAIAEQDYLGQGEALPR